MKQFVIDYLANQCGQADRVVGFDREVAEADLLITLVSGKRIGICVINRAIRLPEIKERYERNTSQGIYTLYVMDGRMMPPDSTALEPPYWMAALHTLMNGRIYGYWCEGRDVTIRPFHMEWKWGGSPRTVEYGDEIDLNLLATDMIYPATKFIDGAYFVANFGEGSFWKKRQSMDERQFNYSWRNWTYGNTQRRSTANEEPAWDPWEEYENNFTGGQEQWEWTGEEFRQRVPRGRRAEHTRHYALLGVAATATLDEVKQAYRRKAREYHPDLHPDAKEEYTAKMADINAAFAAIIKGAK